MKILITGASGFIGSHLIAKLLVEQTYTLYALVREVPFKYMADPRLNYVQADLSNSDFPDYLPKDIDVVIHLAQSNHYRLFPERAEDIFAINVNSTRLLLEWSWKNQVRQFLYASTGNVYARQTKKLTEKDNCQPIDFYGKSKYIGELLVDSYKEYMDIKILRLFGVYGPGQSGMVISNIIDKIKAKDTIVLASRIGLQFTPLYIDDCVDMFDAILKGTSAETTFNIAGDEIVDLYTISEIISSELKRTSNLIFTENSPVIMNGDCSLFMRTYGYKHRGNVKEGLRKMLS